MLGRQHSFSWYDSSLTISKNGGKFVTDHNINGGTTTGEGKALGFLLDVPAQRVELFVDKTKVGTVHLAKSGPYYPAFCVHCNKDTYTINPVAALPPGVRLF